MKIETIGNKQVLVNDKNEIVFSANNVDRIVDLGENRFSVKINDKYGVIDEVGRFIVPAEFDECSVFSHGLVQLEKAYSHYFFNKKGVLILKIGYADEVSDFDGKCVNIANFDEDEYTHIRETAYSSIELTSIEKPYDDYDYNHRNENKQQEEQTKAEKPAQEPQQETYYQPSMFDL